MSLYLHLLTISSSVSSMNFRSWGRLHFWKALVTYRFRLSGKMFRIFFISVSKDPPTKCLFFLLKVIIRAAWPTFPCWSAVKNCCSWSGCKSFKMKSNKKSWRSNFFSFWTCDFRLYKKALWSFIVYFAFNKFWAVKLLECRFGGKY